MWRRASVWHGALRLACCLRRRALRRFGLCHVLACDWSSDPSRIVAPHVVNAFKAQWLLDVRGGVRWERPRLLAQWRSMHFDSICLFHLRGGGVRCKLVGAVGIY